MSGIALGGCSSDRDVVGDSSSELDRLGRPVRRYYEVYLPPGVSPVRLREEHGIGLWPSETPHDETDGSWWVVLLSTDRVERLQDLDQEHGWHLRIRPAPRAALRIEELEAMDAVGWTEPSPDSPFAAGVADLGPLAPVPLCDDIQDVFCQYGKDDPSNGICAANQSVYEQLHDLAVTNPLFTQFVEVSNPLTLGQRSLYALRIGKLDAVDTPQLLLFGTQHAQEWAGAGLLVSLAHELVDRYNNPSPANDWLRTALTGRAVLIAPVANPDGYALTQEAAGDRHWRPNRRVALECPSEPNCNSCTAPKESCYLGRCYPVGVDPNRNFAFAWQQGGCELGGNPLSNYQGDLVGAGPEAETRQLNKLFLNDGLPGSFVTRFFVNYHAYGNWVLYPDGLQDGDDQTEHKPCQVTGSLPWQRNCQTPDFAVLRWIAGVEDEQDPASVVLRDEIQNKPYRTDTIWRNLYSTVGDELSHHSFSRTIRDWDPRPGGFDRRSLGLSLEVTGTANGFDAECMTALQWQNLITNQMAFVRRAIENLQTLSSGTALDGVSQLGRWTGRRIHRLIADDDVPFDGDLLGLPRFWIDVRTGVGADIDPPAGFAAGTQGPWNTRSRFYESFWWKPTNAYQFPDHFTVCIPGTSTCEQVDLDGAENLCSTAGFQSWNGWAFTGNAAQDDCYWNLTGRGAGPFYLTRTARNLPQTDLIQINFSYRIDYDGFQPAGKVEVQIREGAGPWTTLRTHPASRVGTNVHQSLPDEENGTANGTALRTENIDVPPSFDRSNGLQVRFVATGTQNPPGGAGTFVFRVYDVKLVGRHAP